MAKAKASKDKETTSMGRQIMTSATVPAHLAAVGRGRSREASEFDDLVKDWYESAEWQGIPANDEEDLKKVFNDVKRAADFHGFGIDRRKDEEDPNNLAVWVFVRDPQHRGPTVGSKKDPRTGLMVKPDEEGYDELVAYLDSDEYKAQKAAEKEKADAEPATA